MPEPTTLDEAFERYKSGKGLQREGMFMFIIAALKELQARIGAVDEAAVHAIEERLSAMETTIGNALSRSRLGVTPTDIGTALTGKDAQVTTTDLTAKAGKKREKVNA